MDVVPPGIQAVADHGALTALIGQRRFDELLTAELGPDYRFDGDLSPGRMWFTAPGDDSRRIETSVQLVASIAPGPRSLLWGWAHPQTVDPAAAEQLRALGEAHGIAELTAPEVPFETTAQGDALGRDLVHLAHVVAAAAVEATGRVPYYQVPMGGGSRMVFLIEGVTLRPLDLAVDGAGLASALMESVSTDQRAALLGFARHHGLGVRSAPDGSSDEVTDGRSIVTATWDPTHRLLAGLRMQLVGSP